MMILLSMFFEKIFNLPFYILMLSKIIFNLVVIQEHHLSKDIVVSPIFESESHNSLMKLGNTFNTIAISDKVKLVTNTARFGELFQVDQCVWYLLNGLVIICC